MHRCDAADDAAIATFKSTSIERLGTRVGEEETREVDFGDNVADALLRPEDDGDPVDAGRATRAGAS